MSAKTDQMKGAGEEIAGVVADDGKLESRGKADRRAGELKDKVGGARRAIDRMTSAAEQQIGRAIDKLTGAARRR